MVERRDPCHSSSPASFKIATAFRRGTARAYVPAPAPPLALAITPVAYLVQLLCCRPVGGINLDLCGVMGDGKLVFMQRVQQREEGSSQNMTVSGMRVRVPSHIRST